MFWFLPSLKMVILFWRGKTGRGYCFATTLSLYLFRILHYALSMQSVCSKASIIECWYHIFVICLGRTLWLWCLLHNSTIILVKTYSKSHNLLRNRIEVNDINSIMYRLLCRVLYAQYLTWIHHRALAGIGTESLSMSYTFSGVHHIFEQGASVNHVAFANNCPQLLCTADAQGVLCIYQVDPPKV